MKAALAHVYGSPDIVRIEEVETPTPAADEVLVRVKAASVNRADLDGLYPRWQFVRLFLGLRRPRQPWLGIDIAGTVERIGPDVTKFKVGDDVFSDVSGNCRDSGAFGEFACVRERGLSSMPPSLNYEEAATLGHSAVLAVLGMRPDGDREFGAGSDVLVVGASGNVGPFCVQIAKARGARVTAVASGEKLEFVRALGADEVLDYKNTDYRHTGERYDLIVDVDAHHGVLGWRNALKPNGAYRAMGGSGLWLLSNLIVKPVAKLALHKSMGLMLGWSPFPEDVVAEVKELVAAGVLKPQIDRRFTLDEAADALRWVDQGKARGKVLVIPA